MKVLFVCRANVGRSQMGEALFNSLSKEHHAESAGIAVEDNEGMPLVDPVTGKGSNIIQAMEEEGIDLSGKRRNQLTEEMFDSADVTVFILEGDIPDYAKHSDKTRIWKLEDGKGKDVDFIRSMRDQIKEKVKELLEELG